MYPRALDSFEIRRNTVDAAYETHIQIQYKSYHRINLMSVVRGKRYGHVQTVADDFESYMRLNLKPVSLVSGVHCITFSKTSALQPLRASSFDGFRRRPLGFYRISRIRFCYVYGKTLPTGSNIDEYEIFFLRPVPCSLLTVIRIKHFF